MEIAERFQNHTPSFNGLFKCLEPVHVSWVEASLRQRDFQQIVSVPQDHETNPSAVLSTCFNARTSSPTLDTGNQTPSLAGYQEAFDAF